SRLSYIYTLFLHDALPILMSVDSIADFITIIRNGVMVSKSFVTAPHSHMRESIAQILKDEGFIHDFTIINTDSDVKKRIKISLKDRKSTRLNSSHVKSSYA